MQGGLVNNGTAAAGHLWIGVQAHTVSDQSASRPRCATWPAPATHTERREPLPRFPLCLPRPHCSLRHHPLTIPHRGSCAAWSWPQTHLYTLC